MRAAQDFPDGSPNDWKRLRTGSWEMKGEPPPLPTPAGMSVDAMDRATVRKLRHDTDNVLRVEFEEHMVSAVDLRDLEEQIVERALADEEWHWEMPEMKSEVPPTDKEISDS